MRSVSAPAGLGKTGFGSVCAPDIAEVDGMISSSVSSDAGSEAANLGMGLNWLNRAVTFLAGTKTKPGLLELLLGLACLTVEFAAVTTGCLTLKTDPPDKALRAKLFLGRAVGLRTDLLPTDRKEKGFRWPSLLFP